MARSVACCVDPEVPRCPLCWLEALPALPWPDFCDGCWFDDCGFEAVFFMAGDFNAKFAIRPAVATRWRRSGKFRFGLREEAELGLNLAP